ncbi:structure-specific endonuclease subunit SLX1 isoform X2 [Humulus lupulus]|uniref:structure-specific endonuclease subunit SLX1 isoform X2 n=1 Tax=Humulus lupulus TaxID=3486 RepID=UPI002B40759E|nr:structure-specific endonuclease subunit SLX1 isoform X2 [Humulus lupulus]
MTTRLSALFPSVKPSKAKPISTKPSSSSSTPPPSTSIKSEAKPWSVYLIISTNAPIKTYVGVTTCFSRRLKQHNGELKGGAKATRSGRPWISACLIEGFKDQSEASEFESKWKTFSRKLPRKKESEERNDGEKQLTGSSLRLLQHRLAALNRVEDSTKAKVKQKLKKEPLRLLDQKEDNQLITD